MPHEMGEFFQIFVATRQAMGLVIGNHLQSVFDAAQLVIGGAKRGRLFICNPFGGGKRIKSGKAVAMPQLFIPSASNKLQHMREKLDLPNAIFAGL